MSSSGASSGPPSFTLCPAGHGRRCSIGELSAEQAIELVVTDKIGAKATAGEQVTLGVTVEGAGLSPADASITGTIGAKSSSSSPSPAPVVTITEPPPYPLVMPGPTVSPSSLNSLFPVVTPTPTPSSTAPGHGRVTATTTASTLPLDPRLIGGQLAGLAILAAAVTLVVARLSLRPATPGAPSAPPTPAPSSETDPPADSPADES